MKNLIVIISTLIGLNTGYAQTNKPILNNSFPNHITKFSYITKDSNNSYQNNPQMQQMQQMQQMGPMRQMRQMRPMQRY